MKTLIRTGPKTEPWGTSLEWPATSSMQPRSLQPLVVKSWIICPGGYCAGQHQRPYGHSEKTTSIVLPNGWDRTFLSWTCAARAWWLLYPLSFNSSHDNLLLFFSRYWGYSKMSVIFRFFSPTLLVNWGNVGYQYEYQIYNYTVWVSW